jgi:hypothetical protein
MHEMLLDPSRNDCTIMRFNDDIRINLMTSSSHVSQSISVIIASYMHGISNTQRNILGSFGLHFFVVEVARNPRKREHTSWEGLDGVIYELPKLRSWSILLSVTVVHKLVNLADDRLTVDVNNRLRPTGGYDMRKGTELSAVAGLRAAADRARRVQRATHGAIADSPASVRKKVHARELARSIRVHAEFDRAVFHRDRPGMADVAVVVNMTVRITEEIIKASHIVLLSLRIAEPGRADLGLVADTADLETRDVEAVSEEGGSRTTVIL